MTMTIFSTDPITEKPYMTIDECNSRIKNYVYKHAKSLVTVVDFEDIKQDVYMEMLSKTFNPLTYNASTYLYLNMKNVICNNYNYLNHPKVKMIAKNHTFIQEDGELGSIIDYATDSVSSEDIILANEKFNEFRRDNIRNAIVWGDDLTLAPEEYNGPIIARHKEDRVKENYRDLI